MQESAGKQTARELFYYDCLPSWLTPAEIQASNFLTLLGKDGLELPLLDTLGVPRDQIWSVERDPKVYQHQFEQDWGVSLFYDDVSSYLKYMLHTNQQFRVLLLDVEGSHIAQLDQAMESVVLYAWRNAKTVIGTYSTVGRDKPTLLEGLVSLLVFMTLCKQETQKFLTVMRRRYAAAGYIEPVNMALRDLFWLRSVMEGVYNATAAIGLCSKEAIERYYTHQGALWERLMKSYNGTLTVEDIMRVADQSAHTFEKRDVPTTSLRPYGIYSLLYRAVHPWSQMARFIRFTISDRAHLSPSQWAKRVLMAYTRAGVVYIDRTGTVLEEHTGRRGRPPAWEPYILWKGDDLRSFTPRQPHYFGHFRSNSVLLTAQHLKQQLKNDTRGIERNQPMPQSSTAIFVGKNGDLTDFAKIIIRKLGSGKRLAPDERSTLLYIRSEKVVNGLVVKTGPQRQLNTDEVCTLLPKQANRRSVTAVIAVARR